MEIERIFWGGPSGEIDRLLIKPSGDGVFTTRVGLGPVSAVGIRASVYGISPEDGLKLASGNDEVLDKYLRHDPQIPGRYVLNSCKVEIHTSTSPSIDSPAEVVSRDLSPDSLIGSINEFVPYSPEA